MTSNENVSVAPAWFAERLPSQWTSTPAEVVTDREEITVVLTLEAPTAPEAGSPEEQDRAARSAAVAGRIARFREETRDQRISIAREAERKWGRKVAWGVRCAGEREIWTNLAVPVMTRLRQPERKVLDTLVEAGVARSRAHALAWCVRLVGDNTETWLADLRTAMAEVEKVRDAGPTATA